MSRQLTGDYDFLNTYIVNVYPDTTAWINDFENAYNEPYTRLYFSHPGYNDYPVVGVSWEQANAFSNWRTDFLRRSLGRDGVIIEPYRLPTEAEWEYAARAGNSESSFPWEETLPMDERGCFYANFKPLEGDFVRDGHVITSAVGTFKPNDFGLYDTAVKQRVGMDIDGIHRKHRQAHERPQSRIPLRRGERRPIQDEAQDSARWLKWKDAARNLRNDLRQWEFRTNREATSVSATSAAGRIREGNTETSKEIDAWSRSENTPTASNASYTAGKVSVSSISPTQ